MLKRVFMFRDATPCSSTKFHQRFGGTYFFHLQGRGEDQRVNHHEGSNKPLSCWFLVDLRFNSEDRGDMLLRNACWFSLDYMALYPRRQESSYPPLWEPQIPYTDFLTLQTARCRVRHEEGFNIKTEALIMFSVFRRTVSSLITVKLIRVLN
jgi:hypothetical protein